MKWIDKVAEPAEFLVWKNQDRMAHRPRWNRVPRDVRSTVHRALLEEQGFLCCYCEASVNVDNSHVEHFRPRRRPFEDQQLDYRNLHCSCQRELQKGEPRHCGNKKGGWFQEELMVSPLDRRCETRFLFTGNGEVHARCEDDRAAKETIARLGLNLAKLQSLRSAAVDALCDLSPEEIRDLLRRDQRGQYVGYYSTIAQVLAGEGMGA